MKTFREDLKALGYRFQFITLAGFSKLQQREFALQEHGFKAVKHQPFVGTASTMAMKDSTETAQFH